MREIEEEIQRLKTLSVIVGTFEEIVAGRMQKIRGNVLANRGFCDGLNQMFYQVKSSYKEALKHERFLFERKNKKTARVLISANTGLYGDIIQRTFEMFKNDILNHNSDIVLVGQLSKILLEQANIKKSFVFFDFPDSGVDIKLTKKIMEYLLPYETVIIYHGIFKNFLVQDPTASNITGDPLLPKPETSPQKLIFEPSLDKVMEFFETEIFSSLFLDTIFESQLSKFASRLSCLDQAGEKIRKAQKVAFIASQREKHRVFNHKQLGMLVGSRLWQLK